MATMRRADATKLTNTVLDTRRKVERLEKRMEERRLGEREARSGTAMVTSAQGWGTSGSICTVQALSNGVAQGNAMSGCICHSAKLRRGMVVQYMKHDDGTVELVGGGASGVNGTDGTGISVWINCAGDTA